jgi:hypothetical protein
VSTTLQTKLPDDMAEAFKAAAERSGLTVSMWLRTAGEAAMGADPGQPLSGIELMQTLSKSGSDLFCRHPIKRRLGNGLCGVCGEEA